MKHESLEVYKQSYELALSIYRFTETLPNDEKYGLVSQLRRASLSVPLNIAEGYGKQASRAEYNRFYQWQRGHAAR